MMIIEDVNMKKFTRIFVFLSTAICIFFTPLHSFAANEQTMNLADQILSSVNNTQEIVVSEKEMIAELLQKGVVTRASLNNQLAALSSQSAGSLKADGYNKKQIELIKSYSIGDDAYTHIFGQGSRASNESAKLTFRYGLAGSNNKKTVKIAYDMKWSSCPVFTFTDSFGVGWIAADNNSHEIITKTDSSIASVQYYTVDGQNAGLYRDIKMDKSANNVVIGNPILGSANGNYGKHISGVTQVSTQSGSYNMETIHIFVTYGHTTITLKPNVDVSLAYKKVDGIITFEPRVTQSIMAKGDHTFRYNAQGDIVA